MNKIFDNYIARLKLEYYDIKSIRCTVLLGEEVFFDGSGLRHLIRKDGSKRPISEQIRRLGLLKYCKSILEDRASILEYRSSKNFRSKVEFYGITALIGDKKVRVVLRRINGGKLVFLSVMDFKNKK